MVYKIILLAAVSLFAAPLLAHAETADDYFHRGAQLYVFGEKQKARDEVNAGLQRFPNDVQLQKIASLLKKEDENKQQQQQGQQQSNDSKGQQNQNSQSQKDQNSREKNQNSQGDNKSEQDKQQEQQKNNPSQAKDRKSGDKQQQNADKQQSQAGNKDQSSEEAKREAAMMAAGQMTPHQAEQLLDSQKDDEHVFQLAPPNKNVSQSRSYKNW